MAVYRELEEYVNMICNTTKFCIRIQNLLTLDDNIVKQMYNSLNMEFTLYRHLTLVSKVQSIIELAELSDLWKDQAPSLRPQKHIRQHLEISFKASWQK